MIPVPVKNDDTFLVLEFMCRNLWVGRDWYFEKGVFQKHQSRLTIKFR
jgi:hypothetical protein